MFEGARQNWGGYGIIDRYQGTGSMGNGRHFRYIGDCPSRIAGSFQPDDFGFTLLDRCADTRSCACVNIGDLKPPNAARACSSSRAGLSRRVSAESHDRRERVVEKQT